MKNFRQSPVFWPLLALILLFLFNFLMSPGFFTVVERNGHLFGSVVDIFMRATPLIIVSLGMTLVIATGGIDLSVGAVAAFAPATAVLLMGMGYGATASILGGLAASALLGIWNGFLVARLGLQPIIATLIAMVAGRGVAQLLVNGQIVSISNSSYAFYGSGYFLMLPFSITLAILSLLIMTLFSRRTAAGLFIEALGASPTASRYAGLNTSFTQILVYTISAILAGVAGLLVSSNIHAVDVNNLGLYLELDAILAVVIGGTKLTGGRFSLVGSTIGALLIQTVTTTINTQGVAIELMLMVKAIVVIVVCLLQSDALRSRFNLRRSPPSSTTLQPIESGVSS